MSWRTVTVKNLPILVKCPAESSLSKVPSLQTDSFCTHRSNIIYNKMVIMTFSGLFLTFYDIFITDSLYQPDRFKNQKNTWSTQNSNRKFWFILDILFLKLIRSHAEIRMYRKIWYLLEWRHKDEEVTSSIWTRFLWFGSVENFWRISPISMNRNFEYLKNIFSWQNLCAFRFVGSGITCTDTAVRWTLVR